MSTAPSSPHSSGRYSVGSLPEFDVRNWPLIDGGWRSVLVVVATVMVGFLSSRISGSRPMGLLASLALMLAMWPFWLPVRHSIRGRGIVVNCLGYRRMIPWRLVKRWRLRKRGVVLLFHDKDLFFDGFRSKYIDGRGRRDELIETVQFYCRPDPVVDSEDGNLE